MQDNVTQADRAVAKLVASNRKLQRDNGLVYSAALEAAKIVRLASTAQPEVKALVEALKPIAAACDFFGPGRHARVHERDIMRAAQALAAYHEAQP